ncbi:MAG TPA: hypothetical protein VGV36_07195 [Solirubrobacteraceae bacterium]|nr:hypothetical protein [Solirubrobacteraceae bacterium]
MDPEVLERAAHQLERLTSTRDVEVLLGWLVGLDGAAEAQVVRGAVGHLPEGTIVAELQREIERRLNRRLELG